MSDPAGSILDFFVWEHLPPHLADVSKPFGELAQLLCRMLPGGDERTMALRELLGAKDCAVRAKLAKR